MLKTNLTEGDADYQLLHAVIFILFQNLNALLSDVINVQFDFYFTLQITWQWLSFTNSARKDNLQLYHWVSSSVNFLLIL